MPAVELEVKPKQPRVLSGEALPVETTVHNRQSQPLATRGEMERSPYVYRLEPQTSDRPTYVLSEAQMAILLANAPTKLDAMPNGVTVPPGGQSARQDEIARYSPKPLLTGKYRLIALQEFPDGTVASPPSSVEIVSPTPVAFTAQPCPLLKQLVTAFAQKEQDGSLTILQRTTRSRRPVHSVYYRCGKAAQNQVPQMAVAVKVGTTPAMGHWLGVMAGSSLEAWYCYGNQVQVRTKPLHVDLSGAKLLATGFESGDQRPIFLVYGNGRIQAYQVNGSDLAPAWSFAVPFALPPHVFLRSRRAHDVAEVTLVTLEESSGKVTASALTYRPPTGALEPRRTLGEVPGAIAAADLSPLSGADPTVAEDQLHLLTKPDEKGIIAYHLLPFFGPAKEPKKIQGPVTKVDAWAISAMGRKLPVLAKAGERILLAQTGGSGWQAVASGAGAATMVQLYTLEGEDYYAEWLDPERGFRLERVIGE